jgi:hypothetical protein
MTDLARSDGRTVAPWDEAFRLIGTDNWQTVHHVSKLPSVEAIMDATRQVEARCQPCGREAGKQLALLLLGIYPYAKPHEADIYVRGIVSTLASFPRDVAATAVDVVSRTCKFLPTRAELHSACEEAMRPRRDALAVLRRARHEVQDREQRAQRERDEPPPLSPEQRAEFLERLRHWRTQQEE